MLLSWTVVTLNYMHDKVCFVLLIIKIMCVHFRGRLVLFCTALMHFAEAALEKADLEYSADIWTGLIFNV